MLTKFQDVVGSIGENDKSLQHVIDKFNEIRHSKVLQRYAFYAFGFSLMILQLFAATIFEGHDFFLGICFFISTFLTSILMLYQIVEMVMLLKDYYDDRKYTGGLDRSKLCLVSIAMITLACMTAMILFRSTRLDLLDHAIIISLAFLFETAIYKLFSPQDICFMILYVVMLGIILTSFLQSLMSSSPSYRNVVLILSGIVAMIYSMCIDTYDLKEFIQNKDLCVGIIAASVIAVGILTSLMVMSHSKEEANTYRVDRTYARIATEDE